MFIILFLYKLFLFNRFSSSKELLISIVYKAGIYEKLSKHYFMGIGKYKGLSFLMVSVILHSAIKEKLIQKNNDLYKLNISSIESYLLDCQKL